MVFTLQPGIYEVSSVKQIIKGCIPKSKHLFYVKLILVVIAYKVSLLMCERLQWICVCNLHSVCAPPVA